MMSLGKSGATQFYVLGLGFVLYIYRFDIFGVNVSLLRLAVLFLVVRCLLLTAKQVGENRNVKLGVLVLLALLAVAFVFNAVDYLNLSDYPELKRAIVAHVFNIVMMLTLISLIDSEWKLYHAVKAYVATSVVALFIAYYAYFSGEVPLLFLLREYGSEALRGLNYLNVNEGLKRLTGPFFDPNFYGVYLLSVIVFAGWLYRYYERSRWYLLLIAVSVLSMMLTISRTALVGLATAYVAYILIAARRKALGLGVLLLCIVLLFTLFFMSGGAERLFDAASVADRFRFYGRAWGAFVGHPIIGGGSLAILEPDSGIATAHMVYLSLLGKYGLLGALAYLLLIFFPLLYGNLYAGLLAVRFRHLLILMYVPLAIMYMAYDFMAFLEFQYFLFAIGYVVNIYGFARDRRHAVGGTPSLGQVGSNGM